MGKGDKPRWPQIPVKELHENYDDLYCVQCRNKFKVSGSEYCSDCITTNAPLPDDMNAEGKLRARVDEATQTTDEFIDMVNKEDRAKLDNDKSGVNKTCGSCGHSHVITRVCTIKGVEVDHLDSCDQWTRSYGTAELARK